jgi:hypothetical protein
VSTDAPLDAATVINAPGWYYQVIGSDPALKVVKADAISAGWIVIEGGETASGLKTLLLNTPKNMLREQGMKFVRRFPSYKEVTFGPVAFQ